MSNKILILCREKSEKNLLTGILKKNNYDIFESSIGTINKDFEKFKPEMIICDYQLKPALTGVESATVYLIEKTELGSIEQLYLHENPFFILKPVVEFTLLNSIEAFLKIHSLEKRLHKSELKFISFLEKAPIPILLFNDKNIVYINKEGLDIFNASKTEILNKDYHTLIHPESLTSFDNFIELVENTKQSKLFRDAKLLKHDGTAIEADIELIPSTYQNSPAVQVLIKDFTALRKREKIQGTILQILQASNFSQSLDELFEFIFKIIEDVIPIKNMYIALYDKTSQVLSFPFYKDEYSEKPTRRKLANGLTEHIIHTHNALLLGSKQILQMAESDKIAPSSINVKTWLGIPLMIHEDIAGVLVIKEYHDEKLIGLEEKEFLELVSFSIARAIERALNETEKENYIKQLKELNETKDKFFSIISHDLKSPFNSILGATEILKYQYSDFSKEEVEQMIEALYNSTRNIYNLVDNMLRFSKFQIGLMEFSPRMIDLNSLVDEIIEILQGNALKKQIELLNEIKSDFTVWAEKDMLNSIIQNLISNSIKFTECGGRVSITAVKDNDWVKLIIKDTGIGMDENTLRNIFKLDVKKSTKGTQKEEGTGLGLILVKEFVEKNGGKIEVKSQVNVGSEFIVTLSGKEIKNIN